MTLLALLSVSVVFNVLRQVLFKNPHEPPVVFHWFPFVGSTISYGMDPYRFFFESRAKVCFFPPTPNSMYELREKKKIC